MPGIAGMISRLPPADCEEKVKAMMKSMRYEDFYDSTTSFVPDVGVYAGLVGPEDSFTGRRSARSIRGDVTLMVSGEFFGPDQSPDECASEEADKTKGNLGQLICRYNEVGDSFLKQLNGLFCGLLIDRKLKRAILFNDLMSYL